MTTKTDTAKKRMTIEGEEVDFIEARRAWSAACTAVRQAADVVEAARFAWTKANADYSTALEERRRCQGEMSRIAMALVPDDELVVDVELADENGDEA